MIAIKHKIRLFYCTAALLLLIQTGAYSQGTDIRSGKQKHFFFGFTVSPATSSMVLSGSQAISGVVSEKKTSIFGGFEIGCYFSRIFGLSTGFKYSTLSNNFSLSSYTDSYKATDSELEQYDRRIKGSNILEKPNISFLSIPLALNLHIPFSKSFGLYVQSGIYYSIPMQKSFTTKGTFSYSGYYSAYNVLIENITYEGFQSNYENKVSGSLKLKSSYTQLFASAGFQINAGSTVQILLGGFYDKMLSDISGNTSGSTFSLSTGPGQMKSLLQGSTQTKVTDMGLQLTLRIFL